MKILLAVDNSEYSAAATDAVATRPWPTQSIVRVISVVEQLPVPAAELWYDNLGSLDAAQREMRKNSMELTKRTAARLRGKGLKIESVVRDGHPRTAIVDEARKWRATLSSSARMDVQDSSVCFSAALHYRLSAMRHVQLRSCGRKSRKGVVKVREGFPILISAFVALFAIVLKISRVNRDV